MTSRIFQGGTVDWYLSTSWSPQGMPVAGDILTIGSGIATISAADVVNFGTLDNEALQLGGASIGVPAVLAADGAHFDSSFTIASQSGGFGELDLSGRVTFGGSVVAETPGGDIVFDIDADATGTKDVVLTGGITVANGDSLQVNGGTLVDNGIITVSDGALTIGSDTSLRGTGTIQIGADGTVTIDGSVTPGVMIEFTADTGTLLLTNPLFFAGDVTDFVKGNLIDLVDAPSGDWIYGTTTDKLTVFGGNSAQGPEVAKFTLTGTESLTASRIFVGQDGNGGSAIQIVDIRTWVGGDGDWYQSGNWTTAGSDSVNSYPLFGDTAIISSGTPTISASDVTSFGSLNNGRILLNGDAARLELAGETLGADLRITVAGSQVTDTLTFNGITTSDGKVQVTGNGSTADFVVGNQGTTAGDFINTQFGTILSGTESGLDFVAGRITNLGQIVINGAATIEAGATIDGGGVIEINSNGGALIVAGSVGTGQQIAFTNSNELILAAGAQFDGAIQGFQKNDKIDLIGTIANFASYDAADSLLTLREAGATGLIVATLTVDGAYGANDFHVASDGNGGTDITTQGAAGGTAFATLPASAVIATGGSVSLGSLLIAAFGSSYAASIPEFQIQSSSPEDMQYFSYWDPSNPLLSYWTLNGTVVAPDNYQSVPASELADVDYVSGNAIWDEGNVQVPVAFDSHGNPTFYVDYSIQNFESPFAQPSIESGHPTPQDVVNAASAFAAAYTGVANTEDCWNIAAEVASAAGAPMGQITGSTDPEDNEAAGFWRIAYAAPQNGTTISNWSSLAEAGDIMRIGWASGGPHSFTILTPLDQNGDITVFDNVDWSNNYEAIGIHTAQYWTQTNPKDITIYRLDPNDLYLIDNIFADGATIQGTTFNNLIIPEGTADIISGGIGNNKFADVSDVLNGAIITDFHAGDTIDITNLDSATASIDYAPDTGLLTWSTSGTMVASLELPTGLAGSFEITNDGGTTGLDGGLLGTIYADLFSGSSDGSLISLVTCFAAGTRILTVDGEVPVEQLAIGDELICHDGARQRIEWIGFRRIDLRRHRRPELVLPIRVTAGAFGDGRPRRDLLLSPDHAIFDECVLIPVRYLVNGSTVVQELASSRDEVCYYHVELSTHAVIMAEGLPAESYLDAGNRNCFSNAGMPIVPYQDLTGRVWEAEGCAPLRIVGPEVKAAKARLRRCVPRVRLHAVG